ncbi:MAG: GH3 auxin-responsive promoter family protein, partial [Candidatus Omnitrophica bacterium]|nr:GH3 auxin-responsive promoter family protein [Candidatus Omnitrophota bacterium]
LMRVWTSKLCLDHPNIFGGKILTVVSPAVECYSDDGTPCGSESGHAFLRMPDIIKAFYTCPYEVFEMGDYETKYYVLLRLAAAQPIQVIYTCNPSTVYLLGNRLGQFSESIIRDIHDGTLSSEHKISYDLALRLKSYIKKNPARAKFLERALQKGNGKLMPKFVWPEMAAIACWKGGSVSMYLAKFPRFYSSEIPVRDIGYFSSEFRGSIPLSDKGSEGVLAVPANYYEFFPITQDRKPAAHELLSIHQLEKGKQYFVYVTTTAGLCRYDMNDVIEVMDYFEETPVIRFVQKGKGMISFTGEKLSECQVTKAVEQAFEAFKDPYEFIAAVGELVDDTPRYTFLIEFERPMEAMLVKQLANLIENALCTLNVEYAAKRRSKRILPPLVKIIQPGEYDQYRKRMIEIRNSDGQFKILKLTSDESFQKNFQTQMEISAAA